MSFNLQGHRGARGRVPENTLPSFEFALDVAVASIETDLHLSRDGVVVLCHDPVIGQTPRLVSQLTLDELRCVPLDRNPDPHRFPHQSAAVTPLAAEFSAARGLYPFGPPTLDDLMEFVQFYAHHAGKTPEQRSQAAALVFDLELKRVPAHPEFIAGPPGMLEERVVEAVHRHGTLERTVVRSFDHRCVAALKLREPRLRTAVLVAGNAPVAPDEVAQRAGASLYCPEATFVDEILIQQLHAAGLEVVPWTVNDPAAWEKLAAWGVDGITTDYPDCLASWLRSRGIPY